jgi:hypothetical protein
MITKDEEQAAAKSSVTLDYLRYEANGATLRLELLLRPIREGYKMKIVTVQRTQGHEAV